MGIFGPSESECELAERLNNAADEDAKVARLNRALAARVRARGRTSDPEATRAIASHHDTNARINAENARDQRRGAQQLTKPWWRR